MGDAVKFLTLNTHSFQEENPLGKLTEIAAGILDLEADIICLNEVVCGPVFIQGRQVAMDSLSWILKEVEERSGQKWHVFRGDFALWETGAKLGNAILSRWKFLQKRITPIPTKTFWPAPDYSRNLLFSRIITPEGQILHVYATHMMGFECEETILQIQEIKRRVECDRKGSPDLQVLMGDCNIPSTHANYQHLVLDSPGFVDTFVHKNPQKHMEKTGVSGDRLDYIFLIQDEWGHLGRIEESKIVFNGETEPVVSDHFGVFSRIRTGEGSYLEL